MSVPEKASQIATAITNDESETVDEGSLRYAAYANRFRTILLASHRYVAYTSDIGESFRPVAHPFLVRFGYGISWAYILGDVLYFAWTTKMKADGRYTPGLKPWNLPYPEKNAAAAKVYADLHGDHQVDTDWRLAGLKRGIFQLVALMGLPAFTIHSAVRYSSLLFKNSSIPALKTYGPVSIGLGIVPVLPYIFDEPCEIAVDYLFAKGEETFKGGKTPLQ
jgi:fission process protein 1